MVELRILARQHGLITRKQALADGISASTVTRRLAAEEWKPVFPGVYRHVAAAVSDRLMLDAAVLWLGPSAVLSGDWAAWWHDLCDEPTGPVSMTLPRTASSFVHQHIRVRRRNLFTPDIVVVRGVRVTSKALTALESVRRERYQDTFDRALQQHVSVTQLDDAMTRLARATGAVAARAALGDARDGTVSPPERTLAAAIRAAGMTEVRAGMRVTASGRRCWLDLSVPELLLAIEVDGIASHTKPKVFRNDRARQNALIRAKWTVLRYTPWEIRNELATVVAEIEATIANLVGKRSPSGQISTRSG